MQTFLDFEHPIAELQGKIEELRHLNGGSAVDIAEEIGRLERKLERNLRQVYSKLTPWQKVQLARHPDRPRFGNFVAELVTDFTPLAGDRNFAEDSALLGGLARFKDQPVVIMGQERGTDTQSRVKHNFGMPRPEGYRKARRLFEMAGQFRLPLISLIDTPGAYPGIDAEERGQAEAIARCIETSLRLEVPFIAVVIGEGGSGGAIAIGTANRVLMMEHAVYSVISPEGCASILWRSAEQAKEAAEALKLTAQDLEQLKVIDGIVPEPLGGAHRNPKEAAQNLSKAVENALKSLAQFTPQQLREQRSQKFLKMGRDLGEAAA
ncbi:MAG: acetyl-CoA carboxylase carboxyltransferase subunit alpha [Dongiaceae bacterium]